MYIIKQLNNNFTQLFYLGLNENMLGGEHNNDTKQPEQKQDKQSLDAYKNNEWYKKLLPEQQKVVDSKVENKLNLEKKIADLTTEVKVQ
jgi:hypothetical protein